MSGEAEAAACDALAIAMPAIRAAVRAFLTDPHPDWVKKLEAGEFDGGPLVRAAVAGWAVAMGER
ncbi:MAG: hypothetical protein QHC65_14215 [Sphingomonas sp.]|nr:hypothetical protein [Sphingomonas sp.]MDX3885572.1 hypothetical protein [Sphingomonas sp.]